ncbi:MAG: TetR/AcrR family transcriptional regulator [Sphingomonadales bacterium]|nr:TetR/AcrR family transcriptional regulator [Sphingomonadales bacterium]
MDERPVAARGKGRPRLEQAGEIEAAIREAAMKVLVEQGEAATVHAVAQAAGLSRKTLYARHPSREHLFAAVLRNLLRHIQPLPYARKATAAACVASYVEAMLASLVRPDALAVQRLLAADLKCDAELKGELMAASRTMFVEPLEALIRTGMADGEFAKGDAAWTAVAILRLVVGEVIASGNEVAFLQEATSRTERAAKIATLVLNGMATRPS